MFSKNFQYLDISCDVKIEKRFIFQKAVTAWNVSVFGVFRIWIFPHSDRIRRDILVISSYSVRMRENTDQ